MFRKELAYYFSTPIAYIVIGLYLLAVSLFLWVIPGQWNIIDSGYAQTDGLFMLSPWLMMLLCPALTMRLFAEERQSGTWNILMVQPISLTRIVAGKFLAAWTLMLLALLPNLVHYFLVYSIAEPIGNIDGGQFAGSFIGLIFLSGTFLSISTLAGCWTKSQIVAYILGVVACFVLYWVLLQHTYQAVSRGVIDLRDLLVFVLVGIICLAGAILILNKISRK
ncbi:MAG: ABC transporter permease subunit [Paludibacteraceae bacterium]|nr:ABC transporter permease subunit [Paludibacteraceae bacterium]